MGERLNPATKRVNTRVKSHNLVLWGSFLISLLPNTKSDRNKETVPRVVQSIERVY